MDVVYNFRFFHIYVHMFHAKVVGPFILQRKCSAVESMVNGDAIMLFVVLCYGKCGKFIHTQ